jgi:hypothetical protein
MIPEPYDTQLRALGAQNGDAALKTNEVAGKIDQIRLLAIEDHPYLFVSASEEKSIARKQWLKEEAIRLAKLVRGMKIGVIIK